MTAIIISSRRARHVVRSWEVTRLAERGAGGERPRPWALWGLPFAAVTVLALLLYTARGSGAQGVGVQVGARAPGFSLSALQGGRVSLASVHGRPVLLDFFTSWCQACRDEAPSLEALYRQEHGRVAVVGVDMTVSEPDPSALDLFAQTYGITFPILLDRTGQVSDTYQVQTIPTVMFLDGNGVIRGTASGDLSFSQLAAGILPYAGVRP